MTTSASRRVPRLPPAWPVCLLLLAAGPARPAEPGPVRWEPVSRTAAAITGRITFSPSRLQFQGGQALSLRPAGERPAFQVDGEAVRAQVFQVVTPADPVLLNGNRLCGGSAPRPVRWVLMWTPEALPGDGVTHGLAFASGEQAPGSDGGEGLCGTYYYEEPAPARRRR